MKERLIELVKQEARERYGEDCRVETNEVLKNNNLKLDAICILEKGKSITPTIYIDKILEEIKDCMITVEDAAKKVISIYEEHKGKDFDFLDDVSSLKDKIYLQVINREKNEDRLKDLIHKDFLDFSIIYRILIEKTSEGIITTATSPNLLDEMGITEEELHSIAIRNTSEDNFKAISIKTMMKKILVENIGGVFTDFDNDEEDSFGMYVIGGDANWGSACLYTLDGIKELADRLESDLYILPSSIHEIIAITYSEELKIEDLKDMVSEININEVPEDDVLSDNVYYYDRQQGRLKML